MTGFYDERLHEELRFHAAELIGTPFVPHAMIPGAGIDCVHVNAWVYLKTHFLDEFVEPKYQVQDGKNSARSTLLEWLDWSGLFFKVSEPAIGDTLCFQFRQRIAFHTGLMLDKINFIHVLEHRCAEIATLEGVYKTSLRAIYRPKRED